MVVLERVCIMRWDSELEEGVFTIVWCSGVVTGPKMLTTDQYILSLTQLKKLGLISYHIMWAINKLFFGRNFCSWSLSASDLPFWSGVSVW